MKDIKMQCNAYIKVLDLSGGTDSSAPIKTSAKHTLPSHPLLYWNHFASFSGPYLRASSNKLYSHILLGTTLSRFHNFLEIIKQHSALASFLQKVFCGIDI